MSYVYGPRESKTLFCVNCFPPKGLLLSSHLLAPPDLSGTLASGLPWHLSGLKADGPDAQWVKRPAVTTRPQTASLTLAWQESSEPEAPR